MSSRNGLPRASVDTGLFHDPKVLGLARSLRDPGRTSTALMLYVAAVLASWREDRPVSIAEAAPGWYLDDVDGPTNALADAGLVDAKGRIPARTLARWMGSHHAAVAAGRVGASARWGQNATPMRSHSDPTATPIAREERSREGERGSQRGTRRRRTVPDVTTPRPVKDVLPPPPGDGRPFGDVMREMGLKPEIGGDS